MHLTSLFLENFFGTALGSGSIISVFPTTTAVSATQTFEAGVDTINNNGTLGTTTGVSITSAATDVCLYGVDTYEKTLSSLQTTQNYIASLDEQQLEDLITKLELKEEEIIIQEQVKQK